jgi:hypothetical protein
LRLACATRSRRFALVLAVATSGATAQAPDARLQAIEAELATLKKRVDVLEGRSPAPAAKPAATPAACPGWERLRMSMTQADVRALLGEPAKIHSTPLQSVWRYPCGSAYFDADTRRFVGYER